jgi:uncharacterized protein DUF2784
MGYLWLANALVALHFGFILFVILGGLLALRWRRAAWVHVPVAIWGVMIELLGFICPLTPLENELRRRGGELGYSGGFIEHYILPIMYPSGLTRGIQLEFAAIVLVINAWIYWAVWRRARATSRAAT